MKFSTTFKSVMMSAGIAASGLMGTHAAMALTVTAEVFQQSENPWDMAFLPDNTMFFT